MLDIRVGLHSFLNRGLERGWGCGVKRELEGDGGEDETGAEKGKEKAGKSPSDFVRKLFT